MQTSKAPVIAGREGDTRPFGTQAATCPVAAVRAWLEAAGITEGPVFRPMRRAGRLLPCRLNGHVVAITVKRYAAAARASIRANTAATACGPAW
jgi:hypothetical protein